MESVQKTIRYYRFRKGVVWLLIVCLIVILISCYHRDKLYKLWLESGGKEYVTYAEVKSKLTDTMNCQLCGKQDNSMMNYYSKFNTLGVISVNDWNILELATNVYDENDIEIDNHSGTRTSLGTTEKYHYETSSIPSKGIAEINITLAEDYKPNVESLQSKLCQECLDKILESLEYDKWKNEKKEALPMCLVDFRTLKIYSLQEISQKIYIDDFYVKSQNLHNEVQVEVVITK